ncbi:ribonuclease H-like domain-containing protein [Brevibacillus fulvus]|uniref:Uncharacterized protein YprB with RNaseH-like and TPR domain n=1 Tax=Brevibacillus fulvus TaxID=1125967 RepID=A0A938XS03_9BACL|nr:ribonuclease H-like domain-containing protein [Brevibacillus fulvus]MBM7588832.1 uncharacterized protein YprB with RNaseH-like and TPR domain [Brevibacillus fulvus]
MSLKGKLNRLKGHMQLEEKQQPALSLPEAHEAKEIPHMDKWNKLQAKPQFWADEFVMVREVRYPLAYQHGRYRFEQLHEILAAWQSCGLDHPLSAAGLNAEQLLFFDTETTGLQGGVGNTIFLLGYSRFDGDSVVMRQHFLAEANAEIALYQSFLQAVDSATHLVTFNGKSFDWPQVRTRHTLVRHEVPQLPQFGHFDLLHGARRLWKHELASCRLSLIEQAKLGVKRQEDVPGYMAPILYFDYLQDANPDTITGVLQHNEWDVLSLITLYIHLSGLLLEQQAASAEERFEIARWFETLGADQPATILYEQIANSRHSLRKEACIALGHLYKKQKNYSQALAVWEGLLQEGGYLSADFFIELAKIYEHQQKDAEKALYYAKHAQRLLQQKGSLLRQKAKQDLRACEQRIDRLQRKLTRL